MCGNFTSILHQNIILCSHGYNVCQAMVDSSGYWECQCVHVIVMNTIMSSVPKLIHGHVTNNPSLVCVPKKVLSDTI